MRYYYFKIVLTDMVFSRAILAKDIDAARSALRRDYGAQLVQLIKE